MRLSTLPIEIKIIILDFMNDNLYEDDLDSINFYINTHVFLIDKVISVNLFKWYGTHPHNIHREGTILHNIFNRPYSIKIERTFKNISDHIYKNIKNFRFKKSPINNFHQFTGTYGPVRNEQDGKYFPVHDSSINSYITEDIFNYLKSMEVLDQDVNISDNDEIINGIVKLVENIKNSVELSMKNFKTNNKLMGPIFKNNLLFYKLCKPISDKKYLLKKYLINDLIGKINYYKKDPYVRTYIRPTK
jgi:hypothetical protein